MRPRDKFSSDVTVQEQMIQSVGLFLTASMFPTARCVPWSNVCLGADGSSRRRLLKHHLGPSETLEGCEFSKRCALQTGFASKTQDVECVIWDSPGSHGLDHIVGLIQK